MRSAHRMPFGAELLDQGGVAFRLWAPSCEEVQLELEGRGGAQARQPLQRSADGWHRVTVDHAQAGDRYRYHVGAELVVPDPASRYNPLDVHGASVVVDPSAHAWSDADWRGLPWHEAVLYEMHVGTFTPEGTLEAARSRLAELRALGITVVSLMPMADHAGARGWGYDGVLLFAPEASYGTPDDLKRFVDAAHALGMAVLLDVVYNHFGPDGNYLHAYCPEFFDESESTPWGQAIAFHGSHGSTVRSFFVHNALYWIEEFHFDGLRMDAVHAIVDRSPLHIVAEVADALRAGPGRGRHVHLVLENDANTARWLRRDASQQATVATAQWNDDLHHAAHALATGETTGYYADYAAPQGLEASVLARALAEGFVYQGQASAFRGGKPRGESSVELAPPAFVGFLQNHDQIGNRAFGERLDSLADTRCIEALLACLLLSPQVPMLFMGEEFAASTPFLYFCDYEGALADAVRHGRRREFAGFEGFRDPQALLAIPDPNAPETFARSKLAWSERDAPVGQRRLALVTRLLALRVRHLIPLMPALQAGGAVQTEQSWFTVQWAAGLRQHWSLRANFGAREVAVPIGPDEERVYASGATRHPDADTVVLQSCGVEVVLCRAGRA